MTNWQRGDLIRSLWIRDHQLGSICNSPEFDQYPESARSELCHESTHVSELIELVVALGYETEYDITEDPTDDTDLCRHCGDHCDHSCVCDRCFAAYHSTRQ